MPSTCPDTQWLQDADVLLQQLAAAADKPARDKIIDDNADMWGRLKEWLLEQSHGKCWFSEAKDCFNHWHVEHFRPKKSAKDLDGAKYDAYWWLAFDWRNYRICGAVGNTKKGTFFPLRDGCTRCAPGGNQLLEDPMLLDPCVARDPSLLTFNLEGKPLPAPDNNLTPWDHARAEYTITRCQLEDYPPLNEKRKVVWEDCWNAIQEYRSYLHLGATDPTDSLARDRANQAAARILKKVQATEEFSAVARACVLSSGDSRVTRLLQAA
jgi:uncharacterized protein (TIGR02646 family)